MTCKALGKSYRSFLHNPSLCKLCACIYELSDNLPLALPGMLPGPIRRVSPTTGCALWLGFSAHGIVCVCQKGMCILSLGMSPDGMSTMYITRRRITRALRSLNVHDALLTVQKHTLKRPALQVSGSAPCIGVLDGLSCVPSGYISVAGLSGSMTRSAALILALAEAYM